MQDIAQECGIRAMPTFVFFAKGESIDLFALVPLHGDIGSKMKPEVAHGLAGKAFALHQHTYCVALHPNPMHLMDTRIVGVAEVSQRSLQPPIATLKCFWSPGVRPGWVFLQEKRWTESRVQTPADWRL